MPGSWDLNYEKNSHRRGGGAEGMCRARQNYKTEDGLVRGRQGPYSHLQVRDELSHGDFLCYLLVQALAV